MKKIIKYISVLAIIAISSCSSVDDKDIATLDTVSVYSITNITGTNAVLSMSVYRDNPLLIEYLNATTVKSYETNTYVDNSDDTTYAVSFNKVKVTEQESGTDFIEEISYVIDADVALGTGTLTITNSDLSEEVYTISIAKQNRFI
ncbi:hypothetical protein GCM10022291_04420 [Postechiella marina]|uniref:Uncharacterized protein n=1 Tax=Postechiella marina TaxID=943941 RepID=A0ABP8C0K8_9FLAO